MLKRNIDRIYYLLAIAIFTYTLHYFLVERPRARRPVRIAGQEIIFKRDLTLIQPSAPLTDVLDNPEQEALSSRQMSADQLARDLESRTQIAQEQGGFFSCARR